MRIPRLIVAPLAFLVLMSAALACGGEDGLNYVGTTATESGAISHEDYFRRMDEVDKEVDTKFENLNCDETTSAKDCAAAFADAMSFAEPLYDDVEPSDDAKDEHEELVAATQELREKLEGAEGDFTADDPADAFFESDAFDTRRADDAFCAIQDLADQKNIEADVGCDSGESVDPSTPRATKHPPTPVATRAPTLAPPPPTPVRQEIGRDAWLAEYVTTLEDLGVTVYEAFFNTPTIIWLRTGGLTESDAEAVCGAVAGDARDHFGQSFTVRVYGPTGIDDLLARCNS